jgi:V/A-type H+-transporting ATPase subunit A
LEKFYKERIAPDWLDLRARAMRLLQREQELEEIARLVGLESLSNKDRIALEGAKSIREDFLHQNAFHEVDTYTSLKKSYYLLKLVLQFHEESLLALEKGVALDDLLKLPLRDEIARAKYIPEEKMGEIEKIRERLREQIRELI